MHGATGAFSNDGMRAEILNPFVHKLELDNTYDKIKVRRCFEAFNIKKERNENEGLCGSIGIVSKVQFAQTQNDTQKYRAMYMLLKF